MQMIFESIDIVESWVFARIEELQPNIVADIVKIF